MFRPQKKSRTAIVVFWNDVRFRLSFFGGCPALWGGGWIGRIGNGRRPYIGSLPVADCRMRGSISDRYRQQRSAFPSQVVPLGIQGNSGPQPLLFQLRSSNPAERNVVLGFSIVAGCLVWKLWPIVAHRMRFGFRTNAFSLVAVNVFRGFRMFDRRGKQCVPRETTTIFSAPSGRHLPPRPRAVPSVLRRRLCRPRFSEIRA